MSEHGKKNGIVTTTNGTYLSSSMTQNYVTVKRQYKLISHGTWTRLSTFNYSTEYLNCIAILEPIASFTEPCDTPMITSVFKNHNLYLFVCHLDKPNSVFFNKRKQIWSYYINFPRLVGFVWLMVLNAINQTKPIRRGKLKKHNSCNV